MSEIKIDEDYLLQMAGEDTELIISIVDDFESESVGLITQLGDLTANEVNEDSLVEIGRVLHKFRGSSSSLGMVSLSAYLVELESWKLDKWRDEALDLAVLSEHLGTSVVMCKETLS
jgi:HPt (histidine-containing phosphotransfer) domain-containing protein